MPGFTFERISPPKDRKEPTQPAAPENSASLGLSTIIVLGVMVGAIIAIVLKS